MTAPIPDHVIERARGLDEDDACLLARCGRRHWCRFVRDDHRRRRRVGRALHVERLFALAVGARAVAQCDVAVGIGAAVVDVLRGVRRER